LSNSFVSNFVDNRLEIYYLIEGIFLIFEAKNNFEKIL